MVQFFEILPNPIGKDTASEWIKIYNNSDQTVFLSSWKIKDASGKTFIVQKEEISPHGFLTLSSDKTKISLNNNGDSLFLYNQNGELIDKASYNFNVTEGAILSKKENSFIIKQEINSSKLNLGGHNLALVDQQIKSSGDLRSNQSSIGIVAGGAIILILTTAFFIIIKKLNLIHDSEN